MFPFLYYEKTYIVANDFSRWDGRERFTVRGEAANHGVIDVSHLIKTCFPTTTNTETMQPTGCCELAEAVKSYEEEMITRTFPAVLKSRQACLDANHFASVNKESPLIAKRAMKE